MASRKTSKAGRPAAARPASKQAAGRTTSEISASSPDTDAKSGAQRSARGGHAVCANLAALRAALAAEKGKAGAKERAQIIRNLESLEHDYVDLDGRI